MNAAALNTPFLPSYLGGAGALPIGLSANVSPLARLNGPQTTVCAGPAGPCPLQVHGELNGAQSLLQNYCAGPASTGSGASDEDVSGEAVGYGHYVGLHVDDQLAQAQQALSSGQISQTQFDQISQIEQGVEQTVLADDAANNGRKLTQANFADIHSQMDQATALLSGEATATL